MGTLTTAGTAPHNEALDHETGMQPTINMGARPPPPRRFLATTHEGGHPTTTYAADPINKRPEERGGGEEVSSWFELAPLWGCFAGLSWPHLALLFLPFLCV